MLYLIFIKKLAILAAIIGMILVYLIIFMYLYRLLRIKKGETPKKTLFYFFYTFLKKKHKALGLTCLILFLFHGLFFALWLPYVKHSNYIFFGYLTLFSFLCLIFTGTLLFLFPKLNYSLALRKKIRGFHICFFIIFFISFIFHRIEIELHKKNKLAQNQLK